MTDEPRTWRERAADAERRIRAAEAARSVAADDRALAYHDGLYAEFDGVQADMARDLGRSAKAVSEFMARARRVRAERESGGEEPS